MCSKIFENQLTDINFICNNIFNRDFPIVKKLEREVTIFPENFRSQNILSKMLEANISLMKDLPEVKTSVSSERFRWNSKFLIMDYLPYHVKSGFKIVFWYKKNYFLSDFQNFAAYFRTNLKLNICSKLFYLLIYKQQIIQKEECILRGQFQHIKILFFSIHL